MSDSDNNQSKSDSENGGKEKPPQPVGFFDHSLKAVRGQVFRRWALTTVTLMTFILGILSICENKVTGSHRSPS